MLLLCLAAVLTALAGAAPAFGTSPIDEKKAEAQQVYGEIIQLDQSLSAADEQINLANIRLANVEAEQKVNRHELIVARRNLGRSRKLIMKRLVSLYTATQPTTLDLILGSTSLNDLMTRIDNADRLSREDSLVVHQVESFKAAVVQHAGELKDERAYARRLVARRQAVRQSVADRLSERQRLLTSIKGEISTLEAQAAARQLLMAKEAQARIDLAQAQQAQQVQDTVVGATASAPEGVTVDPSSPFGSQVVSIAMSYIGTPYVWGGAAPGGFDCSGLVMYSFEQLGVSLPHSSYAMWDYGVPVPYDQLQPGDLVFFDGLGHVGLYIGGGEFVNAPYTGAFVRVDSLTSGWAAANYVGARRIT
ncbi:MAG TPA: NlpC/P60 family protein [Gaiellaceae bacterium]|nr:NlpC/P60 family protein [Gaiellaceae bacterium]